MCSINAKILIELVSEFAKEYPEFSGEAENLSMQLQFCGDLSCQAIYEAFLRANYSFKCAIEQFQEIRTEKKNVQPPKLGRFFQVYTVPPHIQQRLQSSNDSGPANVWKDTFRALPLYTEPLPEFDSHFINRAREIWKSRVCGNEQILNVILRHASEYCKTGRTTPILLAGPPGIGKSLAAKCYGDILGLPYAYISAPGESMGKGLAGDPAVYTNARPGAIVDAMLRCNAGNPVILIDELDKAGSRFANRSDFHSELLAALDESNSFFKDNYLEIELDISHIPFIFTANDTSLIPKPLLDRIELVYMDAPEKKVLYSILKEHSFPQLFELYGNSSVSLDDDVHEALVDALWERGERSCRPYQKAAKQLVSQAFLEATEKETTVIITAADAIRAARGSESCCPSRRAIGFV